MKKLLFAGLLCLGLLGLSADHSQAGILDWLCCHGCHDRCCNKYSMQICVRQYNAFSPVCAGHVDCLGCMPMMACMPPYCPMPPMFNPCGFGVAPYLAGGPAYGFSSPCCPPSCCSLGCCDNGCLPSPNAVASIPSTNSIQAMPSSPSITPTPVPATPPQSGQPGFIPPAPTPLPMMSWQRWQLPQTENLQRVNYQVPYLAPWLQAYPHPGMMSPGALPIPYAPAPTDSYPGYPAVMNPAAYGPNYWYGY